MVDTPGWLFTGERMRDGSAFPAVGALQDGAPVGGDERILAALGMAPGNMLHRITVRVTGGTTRWRIDQSGDARAVLRSYCKLVALDVLSHWDMPQAIRDYFEANGPYDTARALARQYGAWSAAWDAVRAATVETGIGGSAATWHATRDAAAAAGIAANGAGWDPRRPASRDAARSAVRSDTRDAAWEVTQDAAWAKSWDGTQSVAAVRNQALSDYSDQLEQLVLAQ